MTAQNSETTTGSSEICDQAAPPPLLYAGPRISGPNCSYAHLVKWNVEGLTRRTGYGS